MSLRVRAVNLTICHHKEQIYELSFSCSFPVIDNEFCHITVKVVCGSTQISPHGSTATSTMLHDEIHDQ